MGWWSVASIIVAGVAFKASQGSDELSEEASKFMMLGRLLTAGWLLGVV